MRLEVAGSNPAILTGWLSVDLSVPGATLYKVMAAAEWFQPDTIGRILAGRKTGFGCRHHVHILPFCRA